MHRRIQNRISATRIRRKKKSYVEELETEMTGLKEENTRLQTANNVLMTENSLLKNQIGFLERFVLKTPKTTGDEVPETRLYPSTDTRSDLEGQNLVRMNTSSNIKMHSTFLSVLTILIFTCGALTSADENCLRALTPSFLADNHHIMAYGVNKYAIHQSGFPEPRRFDPSTLLSPQFSAYSVTVLLIKLASIVLYVIYLVYVLLILHRRYIHKP